MIQSIENAIEVIYFLSEGEKGLVEIANHLQLSKSTTHRLLSSLKASGLVTQNVLSKRYMIGYGVYRLLNNIFSANNSALISLSRNSMYRLRELSGETVSIHIPYGGNRLCIAELKSEKEIIYTAGIGSMAPIYVGAASKVLLAYMPEQKRNLLLQKIFAGNDKDMAIDKNKLLKEIQETAEKGYAFSFGERIYGSACLAVPILAKNEAIAALCILGPSFRLTKTELEKLVSHIKEEATIIEESLGSN